MIGTTLGGRYAILRKLGQGGMGAVYEARHTGTNRRVAVKVISADVAKNPSLVTRFQIEAKAAGGIESQYITQVFDVGKDDVVGLPFMVMEYLAGEDVQKTIRKHGPLRPDLALRIAAQAALGLSKAHSENIVHRDIKAANLFLAEREAGERVVKILDFGVAKVVMDEINAADGVVTETGTLVGSPLTMAPEQARGAKAIDQRADIWSLGIVLYQMLSGRAPFAHVQGLGAVLIKVVSEAPPPVNTLAPWVPEDIVRVVAGALQLNPDHRYQSAIHMFNALQTVIGGSYTIHESMIGPASASPVSAIPTGPIPSPNAVVSQSSPNAASHGALVSGSHPSLPGGTNPSVVSQPSGMGRGPLTLAAGSEGIWSGSPLALSSAGTAVPQGPAPRASKGSALLVVGASMAAAAVVTVVTLKLVLPGSAHPSVAPSGAHAELGPAAAAGTPTVPTVSQPMASITAVVPAPSVAPAASSASPPDVTPAAGKAPEGGGKRQAPAPASGAGRNAAAGSPAQAAAVATAKPAEPSVAGRVIRTELP